MEGPERDAERPLTAEGRREMADVAKFLSELDVEFDLIASSPLKRSMETVEIVARKLRALNRVQEWEELKPTGESENVFEKLSRLGSTKQALLVGHEPYLTAMIAEIIAGNSSANLVLKKGGLAKVRINTFKPAVSGELRWILTPKLMKKLA